MKTNEWEDNWLFRSNIDSVVDVVVVDGVFVVATVVDVHFDVVLLLLLLMLLLLFLMLLMMLLLTMLLLSIPMVLNHFLGIATQFEKEKLATLP